MLSPCGIKAKVLCSKFVGLDLIPLAGTFICCLALGIEIGLVCGVGIDILLLLYYHSRPPLEAQFIDVSFLFFFNG